LAAALRLDEILPRCAGAPARLRIAGGRVEHGNDEPQGAGRRFASRTALALIELGVNDDDAAARVRARLSVPVRGQLRLAAAAGRPFDAFRFPGVGLDRAAHRAVSLVPRVARDRASEIAHACLFERLAAGVARHFAADAGGEARGRAFVHAATHQAVSRDRRSGDTERAGRDLRTRFERLHHHFRQCRGGEMALQRFLGPLDHVGHTRRPARDAGCKILQTTVDLQQQLVELGRDVGLRTKR